MVGTNEKSYSLPHHIGDYVIRRILGYGATGVVYEGRHAALGRRAAIKLLHPHLVQSEIARRRFLREGRAVSRIAHPNVVEVFDVGEHAGAPYLVMSLVEGEDLRTHLAKRGFMSAAEAADCLLPVVDAVAAAHDAGIIHRDLKPSNIRLARGPRGTFTPKVLDFGISKVTGEESTDLTATDVALGTTNYMAPEQLRSTKHVDARCDVYALGVLLYECATGVRPFRGATSYDLMHAILTEPVVPPGRLLSSIPPAFDGVVLRAMHRDPAERYASARDLARALAPLASGLVACESASVAPMLDVDVGASADRTSQSKLTLTVLSASHGRKPFMSSRARGWTLAAAASALAAALAVASSQGRSFPRSRASVAPEPASAPLPVASHSPPVPFPSATSRSLPQEVAGTSPSVRSPPVAHAVAVATVPSAAARPLARSTSDFSQTAPVAKDFVQLGTNGAPILE
jgi:serine/threonine-protein kinase